MREPCLGAPVTVTQFAARAGDHNNAAMAASGVLAQVLHDRLPGSDPAVVIGQPEPATSLGWQPELEAARADLAAMVAHLDQVLDRGHVPVTALSRCAVALATLPVLAARHPDAVVVIWGEVGPVIDVIGGCRGVPWKGSTTRYLGGSQRRKRWLNMVATTRARRPALVRWATFAFRQRAWLRCSLQLGHRVRLQRASKSSTSSGVSMLGPKIAMTLVSQSRSRR